MTLAGDHEGTKGRTSGTRQRILDATLVLFNDKGPDRVTTAEIARTVGINEGNLYYHFKTKEALLAALFKRLDADAATFMIEAAANAAADVGTYSKLIRRWFSIVWTHRFLFRDLPGIIAIAPSLKEPARVLSLGMRLAVKGTIDEMAKGQLIDVPDDEMPQLLANVWIVSTYWALYLNLQEGIDDLGPEHLDWGLNQVASLFRPYLSAEAKVELKAMLARPFVQAGMS